MGPAWVLLLFRTEQPGEKLGLACSLDPSQLLLPLRNTKLVLAPPCAPCSEPSRRRPLEGPPRGQGRRATGRPSPPWSRKRAAPPDQLRVPRVLPSPTSSSSKVNVRPLRRSHRHLRRPRRRPDGDEANRGSPRPDRAIFGRAGEGQERTSDRSIIDLSFQDRSIIDL